ncbi:hypothetical protein DERP_011419 [Dermatophagoides pteronyssinus]|uniref:Uncharacterized protein n=1 Tax=Dermatophagoides pteronyssinus TaxID=6956 RepID=A0ABQ8J5B0_DERPT|nr:hypothetical protein DERP_011419 [Dermatophagoides pteronyssinus]
MKNSRLKMTGVFIASKQARLIFFFCNNNNNGDTEDTQDYCLVWFGCSCGFHNRHHCRLRSRSRRLSLLNKSFILIHGES